MHSWWNSSPRVLSFAFVEAPDAASTNIALKKKKKILFTGIGEYSKEN